MDTNAGEQQLSRDMELRVSDILQVSDPLDSFDFNPAHYVNNIFPDEESLSNVDEVLEKLQLKAKKLDHEIKSLTRRQSSVDSEGLEELREAKRAIQAREAGSLFVKIKDIQEKARQSEDMVQNITSDIKSLDYAKRHLTTSMTVLKRLQMMVMAVDQLKEMTEKERYRESAQLVQAVTQLHQAFRSYKSVPQIDRLFRSIASIEDHLKKQIMREFENGFNGSGALVGKVATLHDACLLADVLGESVKTWVQDWYLDLQLKDYRRIFRPHEEVSAIDNVSRRYAWLKRLLKVVDEDQSGIFPPSWAMGEAVSLRFCTYTRDDIREILQRDPPKDVKILLQAIHTSMDFETQIARRYTRAGMTDSERHALNEKFKGSIADAFESSLSLYIDSEDKLLSESITAYKTETIPQDDASMVVIPSSTDLFYHYRETLTQFARLSTRQPLLDLSKVFGKYLIAYANDVLVAKMPSLDAKSITQEQIKITCLTINTCDYCSITTAQLQDKIKEKIDAGLRDQVSMESERENFVSTISLAIRTLIANVEASYDIAFTNMTKMPWSTLDTVGDQSSWVSTFQSVMAECMQTIGKAVNNKRFYRSFCDRFVESFTLKYLNNITKCKPIGEVGAEQMLLDTYAIKTTLINLPTHTRDKEDTPSVMYTKLVTRGIARAEAILKVIMVPVDPPNEFVEKYILLIGDKNIGNVQRILDLKGVKKADQQPLIERFQQKFSENPQLIEDSNIMAFDTITSAPPPATGGLGASINTTIANATFQWSQFPVNLPTNIQSSLNPLLNADTGANAKTTRLNENLRKLVMSGMTFRRDTHDK
ncbi:hypothetical protein BZG36_02776 [Bifiguratus adelaidae]|uniref:Vps53 N-terminal domain-containing protein n=1 Tax=Bifiguratus adelaidae TaxID=1938954 RepID=A0A261Y1S4_9FUNG|nr:hypothetical protein BZG36_02776 [Bifiguratus adelaidae]